MYCKKKLYRKRSNVIKRVSFAGGQVHRRDSLCSLRVVRMCCSWDRHASARWNRPPECLASGEGLEAALAVDEDTGRGSVAVAVDADDSQSRSICCWSLLTIYVAKISWKAIGFRNKPRQEGITATNTEFISPVFKAAQRYSTERPNKLLYFVSKQSLILPFSSFV